MIRCLIPRTILFNTIVVFGLVCCTSKQSIIPGFKLQEGFNMELVANEPLIKDPVDLEFDASGNALVLEMPGYPYEDSSSRVVLLKDTNKDGKMDLSKVYAENLHMASSILPYEKGILVAAPPYLFYCKDENQDEKIDKVDTLMSGFSTGNLQHNYNGLSYGVDNWIYAANGGNSGKPYWWGDSTHSLDLRGQDFRFHIKKRKLERIGESSGGFGIAMDEYGRVFGTHNLTHVSQIVFPDRYIQDRKLLVDHTLLNISDHEENGLSRVYPIGEQETRLNHPEQSGYFSGSCGITYYDGGSWGKQFEQTIWVTDVVLNLIHADKLKEQQSNFTASRLINQKEFLATTDRSSRPVNMKVGPDGNLYIVDMYRKVIEHPEWIPDEMEKTLDINEGKNQGRIYRISPKGFKQTQESFSFDNEEQCIRYLSHKNAWFRKTAQRSLLGKAISAQSIIQLQEVANQNQSLPKLHALWILEEMDKLPTTILINALNDVHPGIRENALIIAEKHLDDARIINQVIQLLNDKHQRVSMQASLTLSILPKEKISEYQKNIVSVLADIDTAHTNQWNIAAQTLAVKHFPLEAFTLFMERKPQSTLLSSIALQVSDSVEAIDRILSILQKQNTNPAITTGILAQLNRGQRNFNYPEIEKTLESLSANDPEVITELTKLRNRFGLPPAKEFLAMSKAAFKKILDPSKQEDERIKQMNLIQLLPYQQKADLLFACLKNTQPLKLQEQALLQLSKYQEKEIGYKIISIWSELSPSTRRYASDLLLYVDTHHDALVTALETNKIGIGEMNFDLERRRMLIAWSDDASIRSRAKKLFSDEEIISRKDAIEKMKPALLLKGNIAEGEKVFQGICSNCHRYGNIGKDVGPVLTEINRKSKESIMHDILDPNAAVNTQYISHRVETKQGKVHIGIIDTENDQFIVVKKMGGEKETIYKREITKMNSMGKSLMMEGLEESINPQQMADLLAFLQNK